MSSRVVVLASGAGTTLQALLDAGPASLSGARVVGVVSDRPGALALDRAQGAGVPTRVVPLRDPGDRAAFDEELAHEVAALQPDLVVLAGFLRLLGPAVVRRFPLVNTHPSLLPAFPGAHAVRDALRYGVRVTGCTVHVVDEGVDTGPVLAQAAVPVFAADDERSVTARVQAVERGLLVDVVAALVADGLPGSLIARAARRASAPSSPSASSPSPSTVPQEQP